MSTLFRLVEEAYWLHEYYASKKNVDREYIMSLGLSTANRSASAEQKQGKPFDLLLLFTFFSFSITVLLLSPCYCSSHTFIRSSVCSFFLYFYILFSDRQAEDTGGVPHGMLGAHCGGVQLR